MALARLWLSYDIDRVKTECGVESGHFDDDVVLVFVLLVRV